MKESTKNILKVAAAVVALALVVSSVFIFRSCSAPPDYEEIRDRAEELIERSFDINDILWGKGLPTYERVEAPKRDLYDTGKTYLDKDGKEQPLKYYYYFVNTAGADIVAFREEKGYKLEYSYAFISSAPMNVAELESLYPISSEKTNTDGLYSEIYSDAEHKKYVYLIPYTEPEYDFVYVSSDPANYDYVREDAKYTSADKIKEYVRTVYAPEYVDSLDSVLFDVGVIEGEQLLEPRYKTIQSSRGTMFAKLNTYKPLFEERRVYLYDTARIDRANSNNTSVVVEYYTYLPSAPNVFVTASLTFTLCDGVWYLASPTY